MGGRHHRFFFCLWCDVRNDAKKEKSYKYDAGGYYNTDSFSLLKYTVYHLLDHTHTHI